MASLDQPAAVATRIHIIAAWCWTRLAGAGWFIGICLIVLIAIAIQISARLER